MVAVWYWAVYRAELRPFQPLEHGIAGKGDYVFGRIAQQKLLCSWQTYLGMEIMVCEQCKRLHCKLVMQNHDATAAGSAY